MLSLPAVRPLGTTPDLQLADGFNGADLRNVGTEAGLFAIRADRDYVLEVIGLIPLSLRVNHLSTQKVDFPFVLVTRLFSIKYAGARGLISSQRRSFPRQ